MTRLQDAPDVSKSAPPLTPFEAPGRSVIVRHLRALLLSIGRLEISCAVGLPARLAVLEPDHAPATTRCRLRLQERQHATWGYFSRLLRDQG